MLDGDYVDDGCSDGNDDGGVDDNSGVDTYGGNDLGCADGKSKYFCGEGTPPDHGSNRDGEVDTNDNGGSRKDDDNIGDNNDDEDVENDTVNSSGDEGGDNADSSLKMVKMIKMMIKVIMVVKIMI